MRHTWGWSSAVIVDGERLAAIPGVVAIAVGFKERRGVLSRRVSVKIFVSRKRQRVAKGNMVPRSTVVLVPVRGRMKRVRVPTDVIRIAPLELCASPSDRWEPVPGGALVLGTRPGTFACRVRDAAGMPRGLSVSHLFASTGPLSAGRVVRQPTEVPPGSPAGTTTQLGLTTRGHRGNLNNKFLDYSLFSLEPRGGRTTPLDGLHPPSGVLPESSITGSLKVTKYGATTLRTFGVLASHMPTVTAGGQVARDVYDFRSADGRAFADSGDSGALLVSTQTGSMGRVVGLVFAVSKVGKDADWRIFVFPFARIPGVSIV